MIIFILLLGLIINTFVYANIWPTITFLFCFILSKFVVRLFFGKNRSHKNRTEDSISIWLISICYLFSGLTELLIGIYNSGSVVGPDATRFYDAASDPLWDFRSYISTSLSGYNETTLYGLKEDFVPLLIWNKIYYFLNSINYPTGRYIGSSINTFLLLLTSYLGLDIARNIFKVNKNKENIYQFLFCSNAMFWMFGSIILRESFILLTISFSIYLWLKWINKKDKVNTIYLLLYSILSFYSLEWFRGGLSNIPIIFLISYCVSILIKCIYERKILLWQLLLFLGIPSLLLATSPDLSNITDYITNRFDAYNASSLVQARSDSLGMQFIINQPIPIRVFTSTLYILLNPFPIWAGQGDVISAYHFFKSFFAIYNYFTIPGLILIINNKFRNIRAIDVKKLFLIISFIFIVMLLGFTSMETRHLGGFYLLYILIMLDFDFSSRIFMKNYFSLLNLFFILLFTLYMLYIFYKFRSISLLMIFIGSLLITFLHVNKNKLNKFSS